MRRWTPGSGTTCNSTSGGAAWAHRGLTTVPMSPRTKSSHGNRLITLFVRRDRLALKRAMLGCGVESAMAIMLALLLALVAAAPRTGDVFPLSPVTDAPLPGRASRFDYQWVDPVNRRLYIAHLGDSSLLVFDL